MRWLCVKLMHHSGIPVCKNSTWMLCNVQLLRGRNASGYRFLSGHQPKNKLQDYYSLLNVDEECSVEDVRNSYCMLAKKYHPDSGSTAADARMFMQIDEAYRAVLNHISNTTQSAIEPDEDDDKLKYRAPQHRQYLSYEGIGFGTPSQRERQYIQYRVDRATDLLMDFKKQKLESQYAEDAMVAKDIKKSKKVKITQAIERLVEDLILESMAKGDFDNLSGRGKPLDKFSYCPHIDPMTHNLNRILMDNGYQPEWIAMQKEIRETIEKLRNEMVMAMKKCGNPMTPSQKKIWNRTCEEFSQNIKTLNKRINDFNLIVPLLNWQMVHFNVDKEIARAHKSFEALMEAKEKEAEIINKSKEEMETSSHKTTFLAWLNLLFK